MCIKNVQIMKEGKEKDFKPEYQKREIEKAEIIIAKNRNGETGSVEIQFDTRFTRFEDVPEKYEHEMTQTRIDGEEFMTQIENLPPQVQMPNI